jgi:hypothetical protein
VMPLASFLIVRKMRRRQHRLNVGIAAFPVELLGTFAIFPTQTDRICSRFDVKGP